MIPLWLCLRCCQHLSQPGLISGKLVRWGDGDDRVGRENLRKREAGDGAVRRMAGLIKG